jgi:hypothetical protein
MGNNITVGLKETGFENVDLIHLPADKVQWRALANTVIKRSGSTTGGVFDKLSDHQHFDKDCDPWRLNVCTPDL